MTDQSQAVPVAEQDPSDASRRMKRANWHIQDVQDRACILDGVLNAMETLDNEGTCPEGVSALIRVSRELSYDIYRSLDRVSLLGSAIND